MDSGEFLEVIKEVLEDHALFMKKRKTPDWYAVLDDEIYTLCESELRFFERVPMNEIMTKYHSSVWSQVITSLAKMDARGLIKPFERRKSGFMLAVSSVFRMLVSMHPEYFNAQMIKFVIKYSPATRISFYGDDTFSKIESVIKNVWDTRDNSGDRYRGVVMAYNYKNALMGISGFEEVMALTFSRYDSLRPPVSRLPDDIIRFLVKFLAVKCPYLIPEFSAPG